MESQKSSRNPNSKPISKNIYIREKRIGFPVFVVRPVKSDDTHTRRFDNLQEAIRYRDEFERERIGNKSILKKRKYKNTTSKYAEIIEGFVTEGLSSKEISEKFNIEQSLVSYVVSQYYKPKDGVEIIIQSKINGIEDPDKIKNITFL